MNPSENGILTQSAAEGKLQQITAKVGVSRDGQDWLETALDPFPDIPRKPCAGYPDAVTGPSVVQKLKFETTITSPSNAGTNNWDCHLFFDGGDWNSNLNTYVANAQLTSIIVAGAVQTNSLAGVAVQTGGLVARAGPTSAGQLLATDFVGNLPIPASYANNGRVRVIAKGFEVHNTTADIYKQGGVTVYRNPVTSKEELISIQATALSTSNRSTQKALVNVNTPTTQTQVLNFLDSQVWKAEEGCYCVANIADPILQPLKSDATVGKDNVGIVYTDSSLAGSGLYASPVVIDSLAQSYSFTGLGTGSTMKTQFNQSGAWFTGLSPQTSLQVIVHYDIERFVDESNLDLVVMTSKSADFDPAALELYARGASHLPPGVKVGANADGDWIKNIADILSTFGVPGMPLVKGAVDLWNGVSMAPNKEQKAQEVARVKQNNSAKQGFITKSDLQALLQQQKANNTISTKKKKKKRAPKKKAPPKK